MGTALKGGSDGKMEGSLRVACVKFCKKEIKIPVRTE
jgi:hypothetical protein